MGSSHVDVEKGTQHVLFMAIPSNTPEGVGLILQGSKKNLIINNWDVKKVILTLVYFTAQLYSIPNMTIKFLNYKRV